jgi:hypothetical protein
LVIVVLVLPYLIWLVRADVSILPHLPPVADLSGRATHGAELLGGLLLASIGIALVSVFNSGWFDRAQEEAPVIFRPPVDPVARDFVYFFAFAPALFGCLISGLYGLDRVVGGAGIVLLMSGLAAIVACGDLIHLRRQQILRTAWAAVILAPAAGVILATLLIPWATTREVTTSLPAASIGHFFDDSFERRTNHRLSAVSGDAELATLISLSPARPHLFLAGQPGRTPWLSLDKFNQTGGVVVWRASDTDGTPPPEISRLFPNLVPEVPQTFDRLVNGRQPLLRVGWAIIRPKQ